MSGGGKGVYMCVSDRALCGSPIPSLRQARAEGRGKVQGVHSKTLGPS
jgi:hypothetical protein